MPLHCPGQSTAKRPLRGCEHATGHHPPRAVRLESVRWMVVRQDTHGTRFDVQGFETEAEELVERFESGYPHHQTYYIEKRPTDPAEGQ